MNKRGKKTNKRETVRRNVVMIDSNEIELSEKVVKMGRVAKVVKGGRRFSFNALTVVGDGDSYVGIGFGKAKEVPEAIRKSIEDGKKNLFKVRRNGTTITHEVVGKFKSARVLLKPCSPGTGIIGGEAVKAVVELGGIHDILTKVLASSNALNVIKATANGLQKLLTIEEAKARRSITLPEMFGTYSKKRREEKRAQLGILTSTNEKLDQDAKLKTDSETEKVKTKTKEEIIKESKIKIAEKTKPKQVQETVEKDSAEKTEDVKEPEQAKDTSSENTESQDSNTQKSEIAENNE